MCIKRCERALSSKADAPSRTHHQRRDVRRAARTRVRVKDLDQIQQDLDPKVRPKLESQPIDESLPGLGQHVSGRVCCLL